jgi:hypothetical protein
MHSISLLKTFLRKKYRWITENLLLPEHKYVGPCHHGMECPLVGDGSDGFQMWRVAATADKGWSSTLRVEWGANNSSL